MEIYKTDKVAVWRIYSRMQQPNNTNLPIHYFTPMPFLYVIIQSILLNTHLKINIVHHIRHNILDMVIWKLFAMWQNAVGLWNTIKNSKNIFPQQLSTYSKTLLSTAQKAHFVTK